MSDSGELLPAAEADALRELEERETRIRGGLLGVAAELAAIESRRLYLAAGYRSFTRYCVERLKYSRSTASRLLADAAIVTALEEVSPIGDESRAAIREAHLRPLHGMKAQSAARVLTSAIAAAPLDRDGRPRLTRKLVEEQARRAGFKSRREWLAERQDEQCEPAGGKSPRPGRDTDLSDALAACSTAATLISERAVDRFGLLLVTAPAFQALESAITAAHARQRERSNIVARRRRPFAFTRDCPDCGGNDPACSTCGGGM